MNKAVTLSKLEALLVRIRTRAAEPRRSPVVAPVVPAAVVTREAALPVVTPRAAPPVAREAVISTTPPSSLEVDEATLPPPPLRAQSDQEFAVEVDMSEATAEPLEVTDTSAEESDGRGPSASQERLAVADSTPPQSIPPADRADGETSVGPVEGLADDESVSADEDEEEEAPVSSRRAVVSPPEERLAQLAFGADEPPQRHTPPPKSGPLPAPPGAELEADTTGVRKAEILPIDEMSPSLAPSVLVPQAARPNLTSSADVVDVIGDAQSFSPETFVALLDASLAL